MSFPLETTVVYPAPVGRAAYLTSLGQLIGRAAKGEGQIILLAGEATKGDFSMTIENKTFDPIKYKNTTREQWQTAAAAWQRWEPFIENWLGEATEVMLDLAGVREGSRVLDVAAGTGGQSLAAARRAGPQGMVLATDNLSQHPGLCQRKRPAGRFDQHSDAGAGWGKPGTYPGYI